MTPKQRVLKKVPSAYAARRESGFYAGLWVILDTVNTTNAWSNHHKTPNAAWVNAADEVKSVRTSTTGAAK